MDLGSCWSHRPVPAVPRQSGGKLPLGVDWSAGRCLGRYHFLELHASKPCGIRWQWYGVDLGHSVRQEFLLSGTVVGELHLHVDQLARVPIPTYEGVVWTRPADIFWSLFPARQTSLKCPDFPQPRMTCARMLAVSHFAQQSAKNSHFRAISRRSHSQSSRASFGLWTRLPNLWRHTWRFLPALALALRYSIMASGRLAGLPWARSALMLWAYASKGSSWWY